MRYSDEKSRFLTQAFSAYQPLVELTCMRMVHYNAQLEDLVDECVQEVFVEATKAYEKLRSHENVGGWLVVTSKNLMKEALRHRKYRQLLFVTTYEDNVDGIISSLEIWFETSHQMEIIEKIRMLLTDKENKVFEQFYIEERSTHEIATGQHTSVSAITSMLHRIRKKASAYKNYFYLFILLCVTF